MGPGGLCGGDNRASIFLEPSLAVRSPCTPRPFRQLVQLHMLPIGGKHPAVKTRDDRLHL